MYKPSLTPRQRRACRGRISSFWIFTKYREIQLRFCADRFEANPARLSRTPLRAPVDERDLLADFEARLIAWRVRMNERDAYTRRLLNDDTDPPDPATWAATIIAAGQVWLTKGLHLQPAGVSLYGSVRRVLMQDRPAPPGCGRGWSSVCDFAGNAVGLFADALSRFVAAWMDDHGVAESAMPWRIACQRAGEMVPEPEDALWRLRTGDGKVYDALPWQEAARMAEADGALARVSLAEEATIAACKARLARTP